MGSKVHGSAVALWVSLVALVGTAVADDDLLAKLRIPRSTAGVAEKREFLREQLPNFTTSRRGLLNAERKLDRLSDPQIDALLETYRQQAEEYQQRLREAQAQLARAQAYRDQLQREYQQRAQRPAVGFAPVVTWLPEGATMSVGAVVSPDRRYVRINAQPFFSSIPRVDTFNFGGNPIYRRP